MEEGQRDQGDGEWKGARPGGGGGGGAASAEGAAGSRGVEWSRGGGGGGLCCLNLVFRGHRTVQHIIVVHK